MSIRQNIIDIAMAERELPKPRVADYWQDVLTPQDFEGPHPPAWCGCFCLYCYHRAGLLLDAHWRVGHGFAERFLRHELVTNVQVGDLAYFASHQHHALVRDVVGGNVKLINGNGLGGHITLSQILTRQVTCFYSIAHLLPAGEP